MRMLKIGAYVVGGLVALLAVVLILVVWFVDPNDFRDDIASMVERQTGRQLTLEGDLKLSVFPWLALQTGAARLSDAPGFGDEPFVAIQGARASVRLLPLLRGRLEVGKITLEGARIRLVTDANGRDNWADLGKSDTAEAAGQGGATSLPTIAGLEIKDAAVAMENRQTHSERTLREFNLTTGRLASGEPFDLKSDFVLDEGKALSIKGHVATTVTADLERNAHRLADPAIDFTVSGSGFPPEGLPVRVRAHSLTLDIGQKTHQLDGLSLTTTWKGEGIPPEGIPLSVVADRLAADLSAQTLALTGLTVEVAGARLTGTLQGRDILGALKVQGPMTLEPVSPREWLPKLGIALPTSRDPAVFKQLSLRGQLAATKSSVDFSSLELKLDDTRATGSLGVSDFATRALRFSLDVDKIDADRYLAPAPEAAPAKSDAKAPKEPPTPIPVEMLRELNANGQLQVGEAIFSGIKFTKLRLGVAARDGKVRLHPSEASMYGGQYRGDIGIDATSGRARISLDEHVSNIEFAPLLKDLFDTQRMSGKGNLNLKATGVGRDSGELLGTLSGNLDFNVTDGALEGADLWYEIRRARALLKQQAVPERAGPARTPFSALKGSGAIRDGVWSNQDLEASLQYLKVTGQGTVDVPKSTLDYKLLATVLKIPREGADASQMQDMVDAQIPVKVTGALDDPKVRPDVEGLIKARVKQELQKGQEKLEDKLKDKLKDLFNKKR